MAPRDPLSFTITSQSSTCRCPRKPGLARGGEGQGGATCRTARRRDHGSGRDEEVRDARDAGAPQRGGLGVVRVPGPGVRRDALPAGPPWRCRLHAHGCRYALLFIVNPCCSFRCPLLFIANPCCSVLRCAQRMCDYGDTRCVVVSLAILQFAGTSWASPCNMSCSQRMHHCAPMPSAIIPDNRSDLSLCARTT